MVGTGLLLAGVLACGGGKESPDAAGPQVDLLSAVRALREGDLDAAMAGFNAGAVADPTSYDAAVGASYGALLKGDLVRADALLAKAQPHAGARTPDILLRRAMLALRGGNMRVARAHAEASGLEAGQVLAAEAAMVEGDSGGAITLLTGLSQESGPHGDLARSYLALLQSEDPIESGLAECYALWAVGQRTSAVQAAEGLLLALPEEGADRDAVLMLWAARAASEGVGEAALGLLDSVKSAPAGQGWRILATRAVARCANGDVAGCKDGLAELEGNAPADGLLYARVTAALQLGPEHKGEAVSLIGEKVSHATARAALRLGELDLAKRLAPEGLLQRTLFSR